MWGPKVTNTKKKKKVYSNLGLNSHYYQFKKMRDLWTDICEKSTFIENPELLEATYMFLFQSSLVKSTAGLSRHLI